MCGIVGAVRSSENTVNFLIAGLKRMEYRGYDSSGIAVIAGKKIERLRKVGKVEILAQAVKNKPWDGRIGLGHTRWATHGKVSEPNAHPHISHQHIALVHNGIIENYKEEKEKLQKMGYRFESETDSEIVAHAIHHEIKEGADLFQAVQQVCARLRGAYALGVVSLDEPDHLVLARMGCPLLIGLTEEEGFFASDIAALISETRTIVYLKDGDIASLKAGHIDKVVNKEGKTAVREVQSSDVSLASLELGPYNHFMQKEIYEQPKAISDTTENILTSGFIPEIFGHKAGEVFRATHSVKILACGSSYYTGLAAKYWLEGIAAIPTSVEIASEYRYRTVITDSNELIVTVSQSGETLDTLEALKRAKSLGHNKLLGICNVIGSALAKENDLVFYTRAGVEICVASTKAFTTQLVALFTLAVVLGVLRGKVDQLMASKYLEDLRHLPGSVQMALNLEPQIIEWAELFTDKKNALFLGRGIHYPVALEGALKLKEITYIHAEGYPAGELKHGPLALVDQEMPVVVIAPNDELLSKLESNMQEVAARGGKLFVFTDADSNHQTMKGVKILHTPKHVGALSAIVHSIPVQLLAYHIALVKGTDVDKPRNLAKSVTVE